LGAIILLLLFNAALAGDARFALLMLTFFLVLFIYLSKRSGTLGSVMRGRGRTDQPPRLAHDHQILTRRDYENTRLRAWRGDVTVWPASFVSGSVELQT
jgi:hypothetical protein